MKATVTVHFADRSRSDLTISGIEHIIPDTDGFTKFDGHGNDRVMVTSADILYYEVKDEDTTEG